jgi:membrane-associated phospholipid phosphatase
MDKKEERILPMMIVVIMYGLSYYFMHRAGFPPLLLNFLIGCISTIIISLLITIKWKISLHTAGLGGLTALLFFLIFSYNLNLDLYFSIVILISGITGTARMITGNHNPLQIYIGFVVGFACVFIPLLIL